MIIFRGDSSGPKLNQLLDDSQQGEILLVESVDRLSRLPMTDWDKLKSIISDKGLKLVVVDLPTTHTLLSSDDITASILSIINNMLLYPSHFKMQNLTPENYH